MKFQIKIEFCFIYLGQPLWIPRPLSLNLNWLHCRFESSLVVLTCYFIVIWLTCCRYGLKHLTINQFFVLTLADQKGFEFQKIEKKMFVCLFRVVCPSREKKCNETRQKQNKRNGKKIEIYICRFLSLCTFILKEI